MPFLGCTIKIMIEFAILELLWVL